MFSKAKNIEKALSDFTLMNSYAPYRFGGKWYVAQVDSGFQTYRTKTAAIKNTIGQVWLINFES